MTAQLQFRNINRTPDDPVETWGVEGYLAAIERGDFPHWHRMREYARVHPWSEATADMEQAAQVAEDTVGTANLILLAIARARAGTSPRQR